MEEDEEMFQKSMFEIIQQKLQQNNKEVFGKK